MSQQFKRSSRIGEQILRDISTKFDRELADLLGTMVTFTHVRVSDDLRHATIYYSYLGTTPDRQEVQLKLESQIKRIRKDIGKGLSMRHIPELAFKFDPSVQEGIRIEQLLDEIKRDDEKHHQE